MPAESNRASSNGNTPKLRTACENCRQSKVKCNLSGKDSCIRCLRHGLACRYRMANRSGKPKGSKNRSTLRKLEKLQEEKLSTHSDELVWTDSEKGVSQMMSPDLGLTSPDPDLNVESPRDSKPARPSDSPISFESNMASSSSMILPEPDLEYPVGFGESFVADAAPPCEPASMSPTFLQKEFITKGLTSFPLAVHIPNAMRPTCDCSEALVFYLNRLRHIVTNPTQVRFDQMLQSVQTALSVCRGFLQCPNGHKDPANLLLCMSTVDLALQIFDYWISYELLPQSTRETLGATNAATIRYGEYDMGFDEARRVRRFLIRGRLYQCQETLGLLREAAAATATVAVATEMSAEGMLGTGEVQQSPTTCSSTTDCRRSRNSSSSNGGGSGSRWFEQIIGGSEAMTDTFLQAISDVCICR